MTCIEADTTANICPVFPLDQVMVPYRYTKQRYVSNTQLTSDCRCASCGVNDDRRYVKEMVSLKLARSLHQLESKFRALASLHHRWTSRPANFGGHTLIA
jgi:hypothetical protein